MVRKVQRKQARPGKKEKAPKIAKYIPRSKAIRRLNVTMDQFRKICIIKGIYPRLPTKGLNTLNQKKVYYHIDDIKPLVHDKVVKEIRQQRAFSKKVRRLEARREFKTQQNLLATKPTLKLAETIKQRYPTFYDALNELGDCLSMIFMFASYRATVGDKAEAVRMARRIGMEWEAYIKHMNALRKCFISVKGYYYTAVVCGVPVTWLEPHQFTIEKNQTVDLSVMHEFLNFYLALMKYVNYKLYTSAGLVYPPHIAMKDGVEYIGTVQLDRLQEKVETSKKETKVVPQDVDTKELCDVIVSSTTGKEENVATEMLVDKDTGAKVEVTGTFAQSSGAGIFSGLVFYLQREVPREAVGFVIECLGGIIVDNVDDPSITHQIGERGEHKTIAREYVQPQWVFDCVNENFLLPCGEYTIGQTLPPHLSPYVDDQQEGYVTERRKQLDAIKSHGTYEVEEEKEEDTKEIEEADLEKDFVNGMVEETGKGKKKAEVKPKKTVASKKEEEERKRKLAIMSGKDRRIVRSNERKARMQEKKVDNLKQKLAQSKSQ